MTPSPPPEKIHIKFLQDAFTTFLAQTVKSPKKLDFDDLMISSPSMLNTVYRYPATISIFRCLSQHLVSWRYQDGSSDQPMHLLVLKPSYVPYLVNLAPFVSIKVGCVSVKPEAKVGQAA